jgi:hypothetical protein
MNIEYGRARMDKSRAGLIALIAVIALLGLGMNADVNAQEGLSTNAAAQPTTQGVESATVITFHGKIDATDKAEKLITLVGPEGRKVTFKVENP